MTNKAKILFFDENGRMLPAKRGRKKIYHSEEEAKRAQKEQCRRGGVKYRLKKKGILPDNPKAADLMIRQGVELIALRKQLS
jgi:hypothetical protein